MVSSPMEEADLIYNIKLSSVGPGNVTLPDSIYEPENIDLAMKLHYLKCIYYFESKAFEGVTTLIIKEPMFTWLNQFPVPCGRFRRTESGRPYIKCNDCGIRFIEAKCDKTIDEWLEMKNVTLENLLVSNQIIGPELSFSPLILIQLTKFKCGGTAVGLRWAHVLGDAFSAAEFMNLLGRAVAGHEPGRPIDLPTTQTKSTSSNNLPKVVEVPLSIKRVGPVGDNWIYVPESKMDAFSFDISPTQLSHLQSKFSRDRTEFAPFETLSAIIWQCVAKIRGKASEPRVVTICKKGEQDKPYGILSNGQVLSVVRADSNVVETKLSELAALIKNGALDERKKIDQAVEKDNGLSDFIIYGANLTFVNFDEVKFYEFEYRGVKPINFGLRIEGVGEEGMVAMLPGPKEGGKTVFAIMPENEVVELKSELKRVGLLV